MKRFVVVLSAGLLFGCGGSMNSVSPTQPTPTPTTTSGGNQTAMITITITGMNGDESYSPNPAAGQTFAFFNADSIVHTATADGGAFDTGDIAPGATSAPITVAAAGNFAYHDKNHPGMVGLLEVPGWDY